LKQGQAKQITLSIPGLVTILTLMFVAGGAIVFFLLPEPEQASRHTTIDTPEPASPALPVTPERPVKKIASDTTTPTDKPKTRPPASLEKTPPDKARSTGTPEVSNPDTQLKPTRSNQPFVVQGLLSTGGEPWSANMIVVKILWLKNKNKAQFLLGNETSVAQNTANGFAYRIVLQAQTSKYLNWNGGVEGNVGRVIAFVDHQRDGKLTPNKDRIIAVSKELIRYRTGRYDKTILNTIQQQNIQQAGKGYVLVRNTQQADQKADWQVATDKSPARVDLHAEETSLPNMYNTFLKLK